MENQHLMPPHAATSTQNDLCVSVTHLPLHTTDDVDPPQNEKLGVERAFSDDSANKLRKVNAELRVGREERFGRPVCGSSVS